MIRWWNVGRYEAECAAFDAAQRERLPHLARQRLLMPRGSLPLREPPPDPWQEFADRVYRDEINRWYAANPVVFAGL